MLSHRVRDCKLTNSEVAGAGDSPIVLLGSADLMDGRAGTQPWHNEISGNYFHHFGAWGRQAAGYFEGLAGNNNVSFNVFHDGPVSETDGFVSKTRNSVLKSEVLCIKNKELCTKNEEFCIKMMDFAESGGKLQRWLWRRFGFRRQLAVQCGARHGRARRHEQLVRFCIKNDELCIKNDGFCSQMMNFGQLLATFSFQGPATDALAG